MPISANLELVISLTQLLVTGYLSFKVYQMSKNDLHPPSFLIRDVEIREHEVEEDERLVMYTIHLLNNGPGSTTVLDFENLDIREGGFDAERKAELPLGTIPQLPSRVKQGDFLSVSYIGKEKLSPDYLRLYVETKEFGELSAVYLPDKKDMIITRKTRMLSYLRILKPTLRYKIDSIINQPKKYLTKEKN